MSAQIRLPDPAHDRPRIVLVLASALVGAALGVATVVAASRASSAHDPEGPHQGRAARRLVATPQAAPRLRAVAAVPGSAEADRARPPTGARGDTAQVAPAAATATPAVTPMASPPPETGATPPDSADAPASRVTHVVPGRVAYVRCDGLSAHSGPYPCPRDRVLEAAVWDLLDTLRECRGARPIEDERGAELRLDFNAGAPTEARFRAHSADHRALEASIERCLGEPLGRIETKLRPAHMVVSFRFQLL